jgi:hypothetical protein
MPANVSTRPKRRPDDTPAPLTPSKKPRKSFGGTPTVKTEPGSAAKAKPSPAKGIATGSTLDKSIPLPDLAHLLHPEALKLFEAVKVPLFK